MKAPVVNFLQETVGEIELSDVIFAAPVRADLMTRTVNWQLARRQAGTHKVKTRSEVSRTKKKMKPQKGGGARHGSRNANIFVGGGRVHGPTPRSHAFSLPKKIRTAALRSALSSKAESGKLLIVKDAVCESGKTRELYKQLEAFNSKSIILIDGPEVDKGFMRAASNIHMIDVLPTQGANVYDLLRRETLMITERGVAALQERLL